MGKKRGGWAGYSNGKADRREEHDISLKLLREIVCKIQLR